MTDYKLPSTLFNQGAAQYLHTVWLARIPNGVKPNVVFDPSAWAHYAGPPGQSRLKKDDLVTCIATDGSFAFQVIVTDVGRDTIQMKPFPYGIGNAAEIAEQTAKDVVREIPLAADGAPVVRVDYLPATKWRVLGLGGIEVRTGIENESVARLMMDQYVAANSLVWPDPDKKVEAVKASAPKEQSSTDASSTDSTPARGKGKTGSKTAAA